MTDIFTGRWAARADTDFVVFLIGMRINKPLAFSRWRPVARAMPQMQQELARQPELGCLHIENWFGRTTISLQYWRDFESLHTYARSNDNGHLPAWRAFNQAVRDNASVGIWHETFQVRHGQSEAIYGNMPQFGLAKAFAHVRVHGVGHSAAKRIGVTDNDDTAVTPY